MGTENKNVAVHRSASERLLDLEQMVNKQNAQIENLMEALTAVAESMQSMIATVTQHKETILINSADLKNMGQMQDGIMLTLIKKNIVTQEELRNVTVENNIQMLVGAVENLVKNGMLEKTEKVTPDGFIVGEELDAEDKITNPRLQFFVESLSNEDQVLLLDKQPGEVIQINGRGEKVRLLETYRKVHKLKVAQPQEG